MVPIPAGSNVFEPACRSRAIIRTLVGFVCNVIPTQFCSDEFSIIKRVLLTVNVKAKSKQVHEGKGRLDVYLICQFQICQF